MLPLTDSQISLCQRYYNQCHMILQIVVWTCALTSIGHVFNMNACIYSVDGGLTLDSVNQTLVTRASVSLGNELVLRLISLQTCRELPVKYCTGHTQLKNSLRPFHKQPSFQNITSSTAIISDVSFLIFVPESFT